MGRVPLPSVDDLDPVTLAKVRASEAKMGHVPHNALLFSRVPGLADAMLALSHAVLVPGRVGMELKWLVGHMVSRVAGCRFCWAHTGSNATHQVGTDPQKFEDIWEFETSPLFAPNERAALRLAAAAGVVPSAVTDAHFDDLRIFYDDDQILEIVAVISMFGFMNRWNDTLSVPLEAPALRFGEVHLGPLGWDAGSHA